MREHLVARDVRRIARNVQAVRLDTVRHVVVLTAPAPEDIAETVHQLEVFARHRGHAAEKIGVR